jgi:hypothetical protein
MWAFFAISLSVVAVAILALLRRYAARDVPAVVLAATAYAWLVSFGVVALVPIDVWTTLLRAREVEDEAGGSAGGQAEGGAAAAPPTPGADGPPPTTTTPAALDPPPGLNVLWAVAYWSTQVLTWLLLPFFQVYSDAGDFTVGALCLTSLRENGALYGAAAAAALVGLVAVAVAQRALPRLDQLAGLGMALSNTFGLCVGMLLLGYGLVQIPREAWRTASPEQQLKWRAHRAGRLSGEVIRRTNELERVVTVVLANERQMSRRDPLRPLMDAIAARAERASPVRPSDVAARGALDLEALSADDLEYNYDREGLAALRRRLNASVAAYSAAHAQYEDSVARGIALEAVVKARQRGDWSVEAATEAAAAGASAAAGRGGFLPAALRGGGGSGASAGGGGISSSSSPPGAAPPAPPPPPPPPLLHRLSPQLAALAWRLRCTAAPPARRLAALLLALVSLAVVWSELTIFTRRHPDLSPFSLAVRAASPGEWRTQAVALLPLAYVCGCVYFALFRLNLFDYNKLTPGATTGAGLMQNGSLMARFAAPTCWNFLHVLHMDGVVATVGGGGRRRSSARRVLMAVLAAWGGGGGGGGDEGGGGSPSPAPAPQPLPPPPPIEVTTVFTRNMGTMAVLPALGSHLNVWLPLLLAVQCALILWGAWDKLAASFAPARYRFAPDDSVADDAYTERGRALIRREGECVAAGMRIGDLLHAPGLASEFPELASRRVRLGGGGGGGGGRGGRGGGGNGGGGGGGPLAWLGIGRGSGGGGAPSGPPALSSATYAAYQRPLPPSVSSSPLQHAAGEERARLFGGGGGGGGNGSSDNLLAHQGQQQQQQGGAGRSLLSSLLANRYASPVTSPSSELAAATALGGGGGGVARGGAAASNGGGAAASRPPLAPAPAPPPPPANLDSLFDELSGGNK